MNTCIRSFMIFFVYKLNEFIHLFTEKRFFGKPLCLMLEINGKINRSGFHSCTVNSLANMININQITTQTNENHRLIKCCEGKVLHCVYDGVCKGAGKVYRDSYLRKLHIIYNMDICYMYIHT